MAVTESIFDSARSTLALIKSWLGGDEMLNKVPVYDTERDIDADNWNKIVAGLGEVAARTRKGNLVAYHFTIANATASLTAQQLQLIGNDAAIVDVLAPYGGSFVALAVSVEGARTAGTATLTVSEDGAAGTLSAAIDGTNTQYVVNRQLPGLETFSQLGRLGVQLTTDASWAAGTTPSILATLYVSYGAEEAF